MLPSDRSTPPAGWPGKRRDPGHSGIRPARSRVRFSNILRGGRHPFSQSGNPAVELGSWLTDGLFKKARGLWTAVIPVPPDHVDRFEKYCSAEGRRHRGTSLWFEDIVGNVATPDVLTFETH